MIIDQRLFCTFPRCFARVVDRLPVFRVGKLRTVAFEASPARAFPRFDVQRQFPDRVRAGNRMRSSLLSRDPVEQLKHGWSMPRFTVKRASKLISDAFDFRHRQLFLGCHVFLLPPVTPDSTISFDCVIGYVPLQLCHKNKKS